MGNPVGATEQPRSDAAFDVGVLFVHGIGQQPRGQTLVDMGEPMVRWLRRWITADRADDTELAGSGTAVSVNRALVVTTEHEPSHVVVTVSAEKRSTQWLLAESWWAESFHPAGFGELGRWGLIIGPWMVAAHLSLVGDRVRISRASIARAWHRHPWEGMVLVVVSGVGWLVGLAVLIGTAVASIVLELFAFALLVLAFIPIPWFRGAVLRLQRGLANGLGDSYVLVRSPFQFAAMAQTVRDDCEWLSTHCRRVVVVAHSQGAAVAFEALRRPSARPENLSLLVTFGQGIRKLRALRRLDAQAYREPASAFWWASGATAVLVLLAAIVAPDALCEVAACGSRPPSEVGDIISKAMKVITGETVASKQSFIDIGPILGQWPAATFILLAVSGISSLQLVIANRARRREVEVEDELLKEIRGMGLGDGFRWIDRYASADPVPNGPLLPRDDSHLVPSRAIRNEASTVLDHTRYWTNNSQFVSDVSLRVASTAGLDLSGLRPGDRDRLAEAQTLRDRRVELLTVSRLIAGVGWIFIVASQGFALDERAAILLNKIAGFALPFLTIDASGWPPAVLALIGAAFYAVAAFVWFAIARFIWGVLLTQDDRRYFQRRESAEAPPAWVALVGWMAVGTFLVVAGVVYLANPGWVAAFVVVMALLVYVFQVYLREAHRRIVIEEEGLTAEPDSESGEAALSEAE